MTSARIAGSVVLVAGLLAVSAPAQAAAGYLDTSFSSDGTLVTDFGDVSGPDIAIQDDGRIVAVGRAGSDFALARYNPDGSLDLTFSGDGKLTTDFGGSDQARGVVIQADDKIVLAGSGDSTDFALARYNRDGSLDPTFAGDGKLTTDFGSGDSAEDVVVQSDGKLVAAGRSNSDTALARYNPDGSLDTTFAGDGKHTTDFGGGAAGVAIQADDRIVTAGRDGSDFALARFSPDGSPDASFSGDGRQSTDFGGDDSASELAIQPDGRIVVTGTAVRPFGPFPYGDFALARYNADGSLDASFGSGGTRTQDFNWYEDGAAVAIQANGKIVVAGGQTDPYGFPENGAWFQSAIYRADGSHDQTLPFADFVGDVDCCAYTHATAVAIQDDGKIVVAGATSGWSVTGIAIARYHGDPVAANAPPTARFTFSCNGLACEFDGFGSSDPDGTIAGYRWEFGDGTVASGGYARRVFGQYGTYNPRLTVTDDAGATGTRAETITPLRLTAQGSMVGGRPRIALSWNGSAGTLYRVYRGGKHFAVIAGSALVDRPPVSASVTYSYAVCEASGALCTATETVRF